MLTRGGLTACVISAKIVSRASTMKNEENVRYYHFLADEDDTVPALHA